VNRLLTTLEGLQGARLARRRPVEVAVRFATVDGTCDTLEGPVRYRQGEALIEGAPGDRWPVRRQIFKDRFRPVQGTAPMQDGIYVRTVETVRVLQLTEPAHVELSEGRGTLQGRPGDWAVERARGRVSIVAREVFPQRYDLIGPG
jgi:hypothetical protein